jgi:AcrR family transcriptional regulator
MRNDPVPQEAADMPGLRVRKKRLQHAAILDAAAGLFRQQGYALTRMEDIAARAEISARTIYNYFASKRDVLLGYLNRDRTRMMVHYQAVLDAPAADPVDALVMMMRADFGETSTAEQKALWLELMAASAASPHLRDDAFRRHRLRFTACLERLLEQLQGACLVSPELDAALAADLIHTLHSENFRRFCAARDLGREDALALARRQLGLLLAGWKSRQ